MAATATTTAIATATTTTTTAKKQQATFVSKVGIKFNVLGETKQILN